MAGVSVSGAAHGIGTETHVPVRVTDALAADPGERFDVVLANPMRVEEPARWGLQ